MSNNRMTESPDDVSFTLTRTFAAPRDLVFKVWTEAEHLKRWWGPKGMQMLVTKLDARPGGMFHYSMSTPDGREMGGRFIFREIVPPERLVFVSAFADEQGNAIESPIIPVWPLEILNTLIFIEQDGKTTLTMRGTPLNASAEQRKAFGAAHKSLQMGFGGTFAQLDNYLARVQA